MSPVSNIFLFHRHPSIAVLFVSYLPDQIPRSMLPPRTTTHCLSLYSHLYPSATHLPYFCELTYLNTSFLNTSLPDNLGVLYLLILTAEFTWGELSQFWWVSSSCPWQMLTSSDSQLQQSTRQSNAFAYGSKFWQKSHQESECNSMNSHNHSCHSLTCAPQSNVDTYTRTVWSIVAHLSIDSWPSQRILWPSHHWLSE